MVEGLFQKLEGFVRRLGPLTAHKPDDPLEEVVVSLLVALLGLCVLATRRLCLDEDMGADWAQRHPHLARMKRSAKSKTKEFFIQLFIWVFTAAHSSQACLQTPSQTCHSDLHALADRS